MIAGVSDRQIHRHIEGMDKKTKSKHLKFIAREGSPRKIKHVSNEWLTEAYPHLKESATEPKQSTTANKTDTGINIESLVQPYREQIEMLTERLKQSDETIKELRAEVQRLNDEHKRDIREQVKMGIDAATESLERVYSHSLEVMERTLKDSRTVYLPPQDHAQPETLESEPETVENDLTQDDTPTETRDDYMKRLLIQALQDNKLSDVALEYEEGEINEWQARDILRNGKEYRKEKKKKKKDGEQLTALEWLLKGGEEK